MEGRLCSRVATIRLIWLAKLDMFCTSMCYLTSFTGLVYSLMA